MPKRIEHLIDGDLELKRCSSCHKWKHISRYTKNKHSWDGLHSYCKDCSKTKNASKYVKRKDAVSKRNKEYYQENKEHILKRNKSYLDKNIEKISKYKSEWQKENKEKRRVRLNDRFKNDINFKVAVLLRTRVIRALRNNQKTGSTLEILGCSIDEFKEHIASMFRDGMSWENHGKVWHIDHKRPCASFDLSKPEEYKACFHYTNMQPLFCQENLKKGDRYYG